MRRFVQSSLILLVMVLGAGGLWLWHYTAGLPKPGPDAFGRIEPQPGDRLYCLMARRQIEVALLALPYLYRDQDFGLGAMLRAFDPQGCVHIARVRHVPDPDNPEWRFLVPYVDPRDRAAFDAFYQHALAQVAALPERPAGRDLREALGLNPDPRGRRLGLGWIRDMWRVWRETDAAADQPCSLIAPIPCPIIWPQSSLPPAIMYRAFAKLVHPRNSMTPHRGASPGVRHVPGTRRSWLL
jgi:hypothetical protein